MQNEEATRPHESAFVGTNQEQIKMSLLETVHPWQQEGTHCADLNLHDCIKPGVDTILEKT